MSQVVISDIYKQFNQKTVLDNVSFEIESGEIFGLIGPNGAGKSTLIDIMMGLQRADGGQVFIDSYEVPKQVVAVREQVGLVPQEIALLEQVSARENLEYFGYLQNMSGQKLKDAVDWCLEAVELKDEKKKKVSQFSGGMQRRLNFAVALLNQPKLLILDEPTVGVDPQSRRKIFDTVRHLNQEYGTTILYTSHYMEEVEALCDRIFILDNGQQVAYGSQNQIKMMVQDKVKWLVEVVQPTLDLAEKLSNIEGVHQVVEEATSYHLIVDPLVFKTHELLTNLQQESVEIKTLQREDLSLEEAFIQLTGKTLRDGE